MLLRPDIVVSSERAVREGASCVFCVCVFAFFSFFRTYPPGGSFPRAYFIFGGMLCTTLVFFIPLLGT